MINVSDYRIDNYVLFLGEIKRIEGISKRLRPDCGYFEIEGIETKQKGIHVRPIELTEEIFLKLCHKDNLKGVYKYVNRFYKDGEYISIGHNDYKICFQYRDWANNWACYIEYTDSPDSKDDGVKYPIGFDYKYVHEIQNLLYFLIHKDIVFI